MKSLSESLLDDDVQVLSNSNTKNIILTLFKSLENFGLTWEPTRRIYNTDVVGEFYSTLGKNVKDYHCKDVDIRLAHSFSVMSTKRYIWDKLELIVRELDIKGIKAKRKNYRNTLVPEGFYWTTVYGLSIPQHDIEIYTWIDNPETVYFIFKLPDKQYFKIFEENYVK